MSEQYPISDDFVAGLADEQFIQQLANQFFKAPPNSTTAAAGHVNPAAAAHANPKATAPGASAISTPASVAGSGISPSAGHQGNGVDLKDPQTSLPDPHFAGTGHVPPAVAGSGRSPSYTNSQNSAQDAGIRSGIPSAQAAGKHGSAPIDPTVGSVPGGFGSNSATPEFPSIPGIEGFNQIPGFSGLGQVPGTPGFESIPGTQGFGSIPGTQGFGAAIPGTPSPSSIPGPHSFSTIPGASQMAASQLPFSTDPGYYFLSEKGPFGKNVPEHATLPNNYTALPSAPYDVNQVRRDFPILHQHINGHPLVWLDNAATTQKPQLVIDRISHFYSHDNSNIHRAAHELAARATDAYEGARGKVKAFLNAGSVNEIVFVRGATEAINLVAKSWGQQYLQSGDEIVVTNLEHHANIVPWQQLAAAKNLKLKVVPVDDDGQVILGEYAKLLSSKTKLVSFTQVSNALGTITPAQKMVEMAHAIGAKVLVDGAQAVSHMPVDVRALDADWYVFSGHKVFGPTGIGVLYGKEEILNSTDPWQGGGNMIKDVTFEHTTYHNAPLRFEAGTGNIADAIGLGAAIDYVSAIGMHLISQYEHYLLQYATRLLLDVPGLRLIGTAPDKAGVLSFVIAGYRNEDIGSALNANGIAVRSGHHCAQPILRRFGLESSVRPSLALYNTCSDIDALVSSLHRLTAGRRH
jgi:cysteine desulfurase/selenocysteine lyase